MRTFESSGLLILWPFMSFDASVEMSLFVVLTTERPLSPQTMCAAVHVLEHLHNYVHMYVHLSGYLHRA